LALVGLAFFASCGTAAAGTNVSFNRAWGWGVLDGISKFETCTTTCQAGSLGGGAGEFNAPLDVVAGGAGRLFVADAFNYRVAEFSLSGGPIKAWGWGVKDGASKFETCTTPCQAGISGGGAGQLGDAAAVAVDSSGHLYVADADSNRIDEFSSTTGVFLKAWGWGVKDGASKFETCTTSCQAGIFGGAAGEFNVPTGVATDRLGHVFIADVNNNRIDEFSSTTGAFLKAWGWGVKDGASKFETCTTSCQAGIPGGGAGQLAAPENLAAGNAGHLLVADIGNNRIDEFSSITGVFLKAWGWGVKDGADKFETCTTSCLAGIASGGAGQLNSPTGVGTDSIGHVFVADEGNDRIDEYSSTGAFISAFGWGVKDGASRFETCTSLCQTGIRGGGAGQFDNPYGVRTDGSGRVYVADESNNRIDKFTPPLCVVPKLKGETLAAANTALKKAQCALGKVTKKTSAGPAGIVLSQKPTAGTHLPAGSKVAVVVSKR
jgi:DNA-binding beta-propeller fold protein YncE